MSEHGTWLRGIGMRGAWWGHVGWKRGMATSALLGTLMLGTVLLLIVIVPLLPGYDPFTQNLAAGFARPFETYDGKLFLLGADPLGRDLFSRLILASRVSLLIGVAAVVLSLVIGVTLGLLAGFFRGYVEAIIMGLADLQLSIPRVLLLIAVSAVMGPSIALLTALLGFTSWVTYGRVARAMALSLREREFVLSAITQGASFLWNIRKHLLPNVMPQMIIMATFELGQIIMMEAAMSYLGLGIQPPLPSLGLMISEGQNYLEVNPFISIMPGIAIFMMVAGSQVFSQRFTAEGKRNLTMADIPVR